MSNSALSEPDPLWKRVFSKLRAFAEAAEMDAFTYQDLRLAALERRIAKLEAATNASPNPSNSEKG